MASDHDTLAEQLDAVSQRGHGLTFLAPFFRGVVDFVLAAGWRPPAHVITTAAQADTFPVGTILLHADCPDSGPCIWMRACAPSEVEDEIDGGTFDHIHWTVWADQETRYDSEDLECHADHGGTLLAVYVPAEEAGGRG
ncbi:hypothetical protein [Nocardia sp. NPDC051833]|uniref:hypothetical protein n=1 Tax=Nocardia sp. NPDC051833 TaxID=3155674 RepID=UPI00343508D8